MFGARGESGIGDGGIADEIVHCLRKLRSPSQSVWDHVPGTNGGRKREKKRTITGQDEMPG